MPMTHRVAYTVGHSVRPIEDFLSLLSIHGIAAIADVRRFPASRRHPQFGQAALKQSLLDLGIDYVWLPELGGRRETKSLSDANAGWRVKAFHAYADYMRHADFLTGLSKLEAMAEHKPSAFMCAEALWTKCHRRLIADALTARGWEIHHILDAKRAELHRLPDFAEVHAGELAYPKV